MKYINRKRRKELRYKGERKEEHERRNGRKETILPYQVMGEKGRENMKEGTEGRELYCRIKVRGGRLKLTCNAAYKACDMVRCTMCNVHV